MLNFIVKVLGVIVIPKTETLNRLEENYDWSDFELDQEDKDLLYKMD